MIIRNATPGDYEGLLQAEMKSWSKESEVDLISYEQFRSWMRVFPEGLWVAEEDGEICGHLFSQICRFDPWDPGDNRNWDTITEQGFCSTTHDPSGQTLYNVSVSAWKAGAGKRLVRRAMVQTMELGLSYYAGASSLPGLAQFAKDQNRLLNKDTAELYMAAVLSKQISDPVASVTLSLKGAQYCRLIPEYFHYPASGNWAALIAYDASLQ